MHHRHSLNTREEHLGGGEMWSNFFHLTCAFFFLSNRNYSPAIPRIPRVSPETVILKEHVIDQVLYRAAWQDTANWAYIFTVVVMYSAHVLLADRLRQCKFDVIWESTAFWNCMVYFLHYALWKKSMKISTVIIFYQSLYSISSP